MIDIDETPGLSDDIYNYEEGVRTGVENKISEYWTDRNVDEEWDDERMMMEKNMIEEIQKHLHNQLLLLEEIEKKVALEEDGPDVMKEDEI